MSLSLRHFAATTLCLLSICANSLAGERGALPKGDWEAHGLTAEQRDQIRASFQRGIDEQFIPGGVMLIMHKGEVIFREGLGLADLETKEAFDPGAPCRVASVTKPHTATMIVRLASQGKLSLDEPIDKWLPEFKGVKVAGQGPAKAAPTLAQCLSHTAGFPGNEALKSGAFKLVKSEVLAEVIADLAKQELVAAPGTKHAYTELGLMTAGRVAEVITGKLYPEIMQEQLFDPIGATHATFVPTPECEKLMPTAYDRTKAGLVRKQETPRLVSVIDPGGSLISTVDDVARLIFLHRNHGKVDGEEVIPAEYLAKMYMPQPATPGPGYGLCLNILRKRPDGTASRVQHTGASGTLALIDFDADVILVILTQVPQEQTMAWRNEVVKTVGEVFGIDRERARPPAKRKQAGS